MRSSYNGTFEALQKSIVFMTGLKLTSNHRKHYKSAGKLGLRDAGVAGEILLCRKRNCKVLAILKYKRAVRVTNSKGKN